MPALFQGVLDGVNYPELPTIYAPVTQVVFLVAYWVEPASVAALQAILIAVDLATVLLLLRLAPARNVLLYAWCPLVVKEIAFTAHPDGVGICLLLAAIVLARKVFVATASPRRAAAIGDWLFGFLLAVSPVINPWYLLWLLPFAVVFPSFWAWTASAAVLLSHITGLNLPDYSLQPYEQPGWARGLQFGLILLALAADVALRHRKGLRKEEQ